MGKWAFFSASFPQHEKTNGLHPFYMYSQGHNKPSFSMQQHSAHRKAPTLGAAAPPLLPPPGSPAAAPPAVARPATMAPAPAAAPQRPQAAAVGAERH